MLRNVCNSSFARPTHPQPLLFSRRAYEIEKANTHLVDRMVNIAQSSGTIDSRLTIDPTFHVPVSMNIRKRVEEIERIDRENYLFKQRIKQAKGMGYDHGVKKKKKKMAAKQGVDGWDLGGEKEGREQKTRAGREERKTSDDAECVS